MSVSLVLLFEIPEKLLMELTHGTRELTADCRLHLERWLCTCLVSRDQLRDHIRFLQTKVEPRRLDSTNWPPEKLAAVLQDGLQKLSTPEVVALALDPLTLHEIFDRIQESMPIAWQPAMAEHGATLRRKHNIRPAFPAFIIIVLRQAGLRRLSDPQAAADQVATFDVEDEKTGTTEIRLPPSVALDYYGVPDKTVSFFLQTMPSAVPGAVIPHLEVYPLPKKEMTVTIPFLNTEPQEIIVGNPSSPIGEGKPIAAASVSAGNRIWLGFPRHVDSARSQSLSCADS